MGSAKKGPIFGCVFICEYAIIDNSTMEAGKSRVPRIEFSADFRVLRSGKLDLSCYQSSSPMRKTRVNFFIIEFSAADNSTKMFFNRVLRTYFERCGELENTKLDRVVR